MPTTSGSVPEKPKTTETGAPNEKWLKQLEWLGIKVEKGSTAKY